jgi:hypothetical protein
MSLKDFAQNYSVAEFCHLTSGTIDDDASGKMLWHESKMKGAWKKGKNDKNKL